MSEPSAGVPGVKLYAAPTQVNLSITLKVDLSKILKVHLEPETGRLVERVNLSTVVKAETGFCAQGGLKFWMTGTSESRATI